MRKDRGDASEFKSVGDARAHDDRDEEARPKSSVFSKLFLRHVHYDAVRSDRGQRWLSDQGGEL